MKKTDKKLDNQIRDSLHQVCESALDRVQGFQWLTHLVNYKSFPLSLIVVCVFDNDASIENANKSGDLDYLRAEIKYALKEIGVSLKDSSKQIRFDSESACEEQDAGHWAKRFTHYHIH